MKRKIVQTTLRNDDQLSVAHSRFKWPNQLLVQKIEMCLDLFSETRQMPANRLCAETKRVDLKTQSVQSPIDLCYGTEPTFDVNLIACDNECQQFVAEGCVLNKGIV